MRKPRDFDAELKALSDKAKLLKERKARQYGELVTMTGADTVDVETLAGALLAVAANKSKDELEGWRRRGRDFFQGKVASSSRKPDNNKNSAQASNGDAPPAGSKAGAV